MAIPTHTDQTDEARTSSPLTTSENAANVPTYEVADSAITPWRKFLKSWVWQLGSSVLIVSLVKWLLFDIYIIPTPSMERNLRVGDLLLVSKLSYGAWTPRTPLQVPLTNGHIWGTKIPAYLDWIELPSFRLPGIGEVERGEIVVFHYPNERDRPADVRTFYVKRCVAVARDTLQLIANKVLINEAITQDYEGLQASYIVQASKTLNPRVFRKLDIAEVQLIPQGYLIHTLPATAEALRGNRIVTEVKPLITPRTFSDASIFPQSDGLGWNVDHIGPLVVPFAGMTLPLNDSTLALYGSTIVAHEGQGVRMFGGELYEGEEKLSSYQFHQDYYFMMGDNRHNSEDSRYWGFVPRDHIVGKPKLCLMSFDGQAGIFSKFRWSRLFRLVK